MERVEAFTRGFMKGCRETLTDPEILLLPEGALVMTYENGIRMLTDYLQGDVYYKIQYPMQNLHRAIFHKKMTQELEQNMDHIRAITSAYR